MRLRPRYNAFVIREATEKDRKGVNLVATHPLQSWEWGEFRKSTGVEVSRFLELENKKIRNIFQITWHQIPGIKKYIGYCPKSVVPSVEVVEYITKLARKRGVIMVKFEPNEVDVNKNSIFNNNLFTLGKSLFTKYSFVLKIDKTEEELLLGMHQKTRYNIRLAEKKGVEIIEDNTVEAFEEYWKLTEETTRRQGFYAHTKSYHQKMFNLMTSSGMGHLFKAVYKGETLSCWMIFTLNKTAYYPYGASSNMHREVMANNLMMWEVIRYAKKSGCKYFDMWGSMGPEPDKKDPWYGFHKFKEGYGADLVEFLGTFDLVIDSFWYWLYTLAEKTRWLVLRFLKKFFS